MIIKNDTVRLKVSFKNFTGQSVSPSDVTLTIYDSQKEIVDEFEEVELIQQGIGQYYYDYEVSDDIQDYFIYEYRGIHNNKPILSRGEVGVRFNKS